MISVQPTRFPLFSGCFRSPGEPSVTRTVNEEAEKGRRRKGIATKMDNAPSSSDRFPFFRNISNLHRHYALSTWCSPRRYIGGMLSVESARRVQKDGQTIRQSLKLLHLLLRVARVHRILTFWSPHDIE